jgi:hypothetical protein
MLPKIIPNRFFERIHPGKDHAGMRGIALTSIQPRVFSEYFFRHLF